MSLGRRRTCTVTRRGERYAQLLRLEQTDPTGLLALAEVHRHIGNLAPSPAFAEPGALTGAIVETEYPGEQETAA